MIGILGRVKPATRKEGGDDYGKTALHVAASVGEKAVAGLLLTKGANVNARDKQALVSNVANCASPLMHPLRKDA